MAINLKKLNSTLFIIEALQFKNQAILLAVN